MPQIDRVTIHRRTIPLKRPFVTAVRTAYSLDALLVEVRDSDGRSGWGEAPTNWRVTGESIESVSAAVVGPLTGAIAGLSSTEPDAASEAMERAVVRNSSARMALDCALYDLAASAAGVPLFRYLGGDAIEVRTDLTVSAVVTDAELAERVRTALEYARAGFRTFKVKVGAGGDDVRTLIDVRTSLGADVRLRLDANQGWRPQQAVKVIGSLEDAGVDMELVEQPVHRDDIEGLAFVTRHVQTPIMADESVWTRRDLREIVNARAADMINIKLAKTGGLREALNVARAARESGVGVVVGCMAESHVGIAAAAAMASVMDRGDQNGPLVHDLDGGLLLTASPVEGGVVYRRDMVRLAEAPGTGIVRLAASRSGVVGAPT